MRRCFSSGNVCSVDIELAVIAATSTNKQFDYAFWEAATKRGGPRLVGSCVLVVVQIPVKQPLVKIVRRMMPTTATSDHVAPCLAPVINTVIQAASRNEARV